MNNIDLDREVKQKAISEASGMNSRLRWIRERLGLQLSEVCKQLDIPLSTLHGWENHSRTHMYEALLILVLYYDNKWQEKYIGGFPRHDAKEVEYINLNFIIIGKDPNLEDVKDMNKKIHEKIKQEMLNLAIENQAQKAQLNLLQGLEDYD